MLRLCKPFVVMFSLMVSRSDLFAKSVISGLHFIYVYELSKFRCVVLHGKWFIYKINMFIRFKNLAESIGIVRGKRCQSASRCLSS